MLKSPKFHYVDYTNLIFFAESGCEIFEKRQSIFKIF